MMLQAAASALVRPKGICVDDGGPLMGVTDQGTSVRRLREPHRSDLAFDQTL